MPIVPLVCDRAPTLTYDESRRERILERDRMLASRVVTGAGARRTRTQARQRSRQATPRILRSEFSALGTTR
jgi:hypothetical protein